MKMSKNRHVCTSLQKVWKYRKSERWNNKLKSHDSAENLLAEVHNFLYSSETWFKIILIHVCFVQKLKYFMQLLRMINNKYIICIQTMFFYDFTP